MTGFFQATLGVLLFFLSWELKAVVLTSGAMVGSMVQPTSSYYHLVYGAHFGIGLDSKLLMLDGYYFERPKFESNGFVDQDYGGFALLATKLNKSKNHEVIAGAGMGRVNGYIASLEDLEGVEGSNLRRYSMPGPAFLIQYQKVFKNFELKAAHVSFIGKGEDQEVEARVAWPYNFLFFEMAYVL